MNLSIHPSIYLLHNGDIIKDIIGIYQPAIREMSYGKII